MKSRIVLTTATIALLAIISAVVYGLYVIHVRLPNTSMDFSALWHTTDAICLFVSRHNVWPKNWEDLSDAIDETNAGYGTPDPKQLRERIDVNFFIDLQSADDAEWLVRVRSGRLPGEAAAANHQLRSNLD